MDITSNNGKPRQGWMPKLDADIDVVTPSHQAAPRSMTAKIEKAGNEVMEFRGHP